MATQDVEVYGPPVNGVAPLVATETHEVPDPAPVDDLAAQVEQLTAQLETLTAGLAAATSLAQMRNAAKAAQ